MLKTMLIQTDNAEIKTHAHMTLKTMSTAILSAATLMRVLTIVATMRTVTESVATLTLVLSTLKMMQIMTGCANKKTLAPMI
jgi:hypothetical protein